MYLAVLVPSQPPLIEAVGNGFVWMFRFLGLLVGPLLVLGGALGTIIEVVRWVVRRAE